jgi:menaquinone-dependent protoporphyrinogen oxidase
MRVLVTWGSERGGTEGIALAIADVLLQRGYNVTAVPARDAPPPDQFDAAIIGGALYANRWHREARRYARRHVNTLRRLPVWFFSTGPLDASADAGAIEPTAQVRSLMARIGVRDHVTFGGRLAPDAAGFVARAMAKTQAGDWRNLDRVRGWAKQVADGLPTATPGSAIDVPGSSLLRLFAYACEGAAASTLALLALLFVLPVGIAIAVAVPITAVVFAFVANRYFRAPGAREPLPTALIFVAVTAVPGVIEHGPAAASHVIGFWLPLALVFVVTWAVGGIRSTLPWPKRPTLQEST